MRLTSAETARTRRVISWAHPEWLPAHLDGLVTFALGALTGCLLALGLVVIAHAPSPHTSVASHAHEDLIPVDMMPRSVTHVTRHLVIVEPTTFAPRGSYAEADEEAPRHATAHRKASARLSTKDADLLSSALAP